jgi:hypothetical protein
MVEWNWHLALYIFLVLRIFKRFFRYLKNIFRCLKVFKVIFTFFINFCHEKSLFFNFFIGCLEPNIIYLCFYGTLQFKNTFQRGIVIDFANIFVTLIFVFAGIFYGYFFYIALYKYDRKNLESYLD